MKGLIEALTIFSKYTDAAYPIHCEHDVLYICSVDPSLISEEDIERLDVLGFFISEEMGEPMFQSFRYGSC